MFHTLQNLHFVRQQGLHFLWLGHDQNGQACTLTATHLGHEITRVILRRSDQADEQRYQLASGAPGTLPYHSWMVEKGDEAWPVNTQELTTPDRYLSAFFLSETALRLASPLSEQTHIYGLGERTGAMDKRGQAFPVWNVDPPAQHTLQTVTMYVSIPFYLSLDNGTGQAQGVLVDHTGMVSVDLDREQPGSAHLTIEGDILPVYFFAGPTPADVLRQYSELTGRMPLPPRWSLGYHQCRWSYASAARVQEIASTLRARRHPCDAIWLDIDYMDGFRDFTWHPEHFPEPARLSQALHQQGLHLVTILDPGIKHAETDMAYQQGQAADYFCRYPDGTSFTGGVWPGDCVFPDFSRQEVRHWWGNLCAHLLDVGVDGLWNDMNEPAMTNLLSRQSTEMLHGKTMDSDVLHLAGGAQSSGPDGQTVPHRIFHNAYGMEMARASYEGQRRLRPDGRPFVLSRSGTGGIQRYAAIWTGDNTSRWEHISLAITMCLNLSMSGVPFIGIDIGGFWQDSNGELLVRFTQAAALLPFCRNHSAQQTQDQEPWAFGEPYESACRAAIELRYRLQPYLYTLFADAARTGAPIIRPLYYHFPQDEQASQSEQAFLLGESLLSAPISRKGAHEREVYLPAGTWFDYWTGQRYQGGQSYTIPVTLTQWPLFVHANSILPQGPLMQYTGELPVDPLTIHCYLAGEGQASYTLYEDDGETQEHTRGVFAETFITCTAQQNQVSVSLEERFTRYRPERTWYEIVVHHNERELTARARAGEGQVQLTLS